MRVLLIVHADELHYMSVLFVEEPGVAEGILALRVPAGRGGHPSAGQRIAFHDAQVIVELLQFDGFAISFTWGADCSISATCDFEASPLLSWVVFETNDGSVRMNSVTVCVFPARSILAEAETVDDQRVNVRLPAARVPRRGTAPASGCSS